MAARFSRKPAGEGAWTSTLAGKYDESHKQAVENWPKFNFDMPKIELLPACLAIRAVIACGMNIYTSGEYHRRHPTGGMEDAQWKAAQIEALIRRSGLSFQSAAEIGCGSGEIIARLSESFPGTDFLGCDISPSLETLWAERENQHVRFRRGDFLEEHDLFDLLLMIDVFEHIPDYMGFLTAVRNRARHHIFHIPLELSAQGILRDVPMRTREIVGHLHYFSRTTAIATLQDCGYTLLEAVYTNSSLDCAKTSRARALNIVRNPMFKLFPELTVKLLGGCSLLVLAVGRS